MYTGIVALSENVTFVSSLETPHQDNRFRIKFFVAKQQTTEKKYLHTTTAYFIQQQQQQHYSHTIIFNGCLYPQVGRRHISSVWRLVSVHGHCQDIPGPYHYKGLSHSPLSS